MHKIRFFTQFPLSGVISARLAFLLFAMVAVSVQANLTHRYSFNDGTANDYVGGANGVLVNGATVSGGRLVLVNDGTNANPATGRYLSLSTNILKTRNFTVECWFTWNGGNPWQRILDFGNRNGLYGVNFIILTMDLQYHPLGELAIGSGSGYDYIAGDIPFPQGGEHHLAYVVNLDAALQELYLDGLLIASGTTYRNPSTATLTNFWIGRSQFRADPFFAGTIDELRTYDNALTDMQILVDWAAGPDVQLVQFATFQNTNLFITAPDLAKYGVPGFTNTALHLIFSSMSPASDNQGSLSLVNTQAWVQRYDGPAHGQDLPSQMVVDGMQNVIVAGNSPGTSSDFVIVKYASDGTPLWTNRYDGPAHLDDYVGYLAVDVSGNVYVSGTSEVTNMIWDVVTLKYSANGNLLWSSHNNRYGTNYCGAAGLTVDAAGNVFVAATIFYADSAFIAIKYDPQGNAVWTNYYKGSDSGDDYIWAMTIDKSGNLFVTGDSDGQGTGLNYATLKYAADGTPLWTNRYVNGFTAIPTAITADGDGNVIVTGDSFSPDHLYTTIKYSNGGIPLWTNSVPGPTYQGGTVPCLAVDLAGNVFLTGGSPGADATNASFSTVKLSASGVPLWTNSFFETNYDNAQPIGTAVDSAGNFYFAGHSSEPGGIPVDFVTIKYDATGNAVWTNRFGHLSPYPKNEVRSIVVDQLGNVYVTGGSFWLGSLGDFTTVKYSDYICYMPPTNFTGTDTFTFTAVDCFGNCATGVVTVAVLPTNLLFNVSASRFNALGMQLQVDGVRGTNKVTIYASTNLLQWKPVFTNQAVLGSAQFVDLAATNMQRRFYRAVQ
jgi:hypothetical protein